MEVHIKNIQFAKNRVKLTHSLVEWIVIGLQIKSGQHFTVNKVYFLIIVKNRVNASRGKRNKRKKTRLMYSESSLSLLARLTPPLAVAVAGLSFRCDRVVKCGVRKEMEFVKL